MGGARKTALVVLSLVAAGALSACTPAIVTHGTYAGGGGAQAPYLNVGPLIYEVQVSQAINPYMSEDEPFLGGLSSAEREPKPGEEWFGVFMQVYNHTKKAHRAVSNITIEDTQGNKYTPITLPASNLFAYRASVIPPGGQIPALGSVADEGFTQGALLLYKISLESLNNRPLTITIQGPGKKETATAELDT